MLHTLHIILKFISCLIADETVYEFTVTKIIVGQYTYIFAQSFTLKDTAQPFPVTSGIVPCHINILHVADDTVFVVARNVLHSYSRASGVWMNHWQIICP